MSPQRYSDESQFYFAISTISPKKANTANVIATGIKRTRSTNTGSK